MDLQIKKWIGNADQYYRENDVIDTYTIQQLLGEGRYGIVYLAVDGENNQYVVKQLKKDMMKKSGNKLFYEEMVLRKLQHPCFPKFISNFKDGTREGYILEYMEGEVFEDILQKEGHQFSREEIYEICGQLLDIIEVLHGCGIVHRDIRLPNVIRKDNKELSLIDFGLARIMRPDYYTKESDYWYIGDFLIHLYYSTYQKVSRIDKPWFKELDLNPEEKVFLRKLMGIEKTYGSIAEIRQQLDKVKKGN
ncbi:MAG TPA: protein kinase family protein [Clostridiales bacterium]|nr:protein kinase family protein [Clostridiales bacterium]